MSNKIKVEFCQNNISRHASSQTAFAYAKEHVSADVINVVEMKCGGICVACKMSPYVLIDKKYVTALDADEFFQRFKKELEKQVEANTARKAI
jgi:uncharacterized protein YuzB (UPF0349 family)